MCLSPSQPSLFVSNTQTLFLLQSLSLKSLFLQTYKTEINEVAIVVEVACEVTGVEILETLFFQLKLLSLDHGVLHLYYFAVGFLDLATK